MSIFFLFSEEFERSEGESIWDVRLPIDLVKDYLQRQHNVRYQSNLWVYTQLKRYEDEIGVKLFRKESIGSDPQDFALCINFPFENFLQKQHLYVNLKIKVANGVYEKIRHSAEAVGERRPIRLLLGAGSTIFHLASILAEKSREDATKYLIYTHNLGALQQILNPKVDFQNIEVFMPQGRVDPATYTIVGSPTPMFESSHFDFIVQGTSRVFDGKLYIESREEWERKRTILRECEGRKILVLTKHEFSDEPFKGIEPYGEIGDYDWVIVPKRSAEGGTKKRYEHLFDECSSLLEPEIISWNYEIYRVVAES
jgi:DeoR/GlpR family transcriptional regulator of sugar metabolism